MSKEAALKLPWPDPSLKLEAYKTTFCCSDDCIVHGDSSLFNGLSSCYYFRETNERRRPIELGADQKFNYSEMFYFTTNEKAKSCRNEYEYLYHPLNFRKQPCSREGCNERYCPYYHDPAEERLYAEFRLNLYTHISILVKNWKKNLRGGNLSIKIAIFFFKGIKLEF